MATGLTLLTAEHEPTACYGSQIHCFWHNVDEPGRSYRVCFECRHAFTTEAALLTEHNKQLARYPELVPETDVVRVFCCPLCLHDW